MGGGTSYRVQSLESIRAKTLVAFVALIIRNKIYTSLDDEQENLFTKQNYMTVPAAIRELEKIEMVRGADGKYCLDHAVTARQKKILKAFGISQNTIISKSGQIRKILSDSLENDLSVKKFGS